MWLRLSSHREETTIDGDARVAWASHELPCRVGIQFTDALAEQVIPFMRKLLGPVPVVTGE